MFIKFYKIYGIPQIRQINESMERYLFGKNLLKSFGFKSW